MAQEHSAHLERKSREGFLDTITTPSIKGMSRQDPWQRYREAALKDLPRLQKLWAESGCSRYN